MSQRNPKRLSSAIPDEKRGGPEDSSRRPSIEIEYVANRDRINKLFDAIVAGLRPS